MKPRPWWLIAATVFATIACAWLASVPMGILYGTMPEPPFDLILQAAVRGLFVFLAGTLFLAVAWIARAQGRGIGWWIAFTLLSVPASAGMLFLTRL